MSIYSGSSPFSRGKLGANRLSGMRTLGVKISRGGRKRKLSKINALRVAKRNRLTGTTASGGRGGAVVFNFISAGDSARLKQINSQALTATSGIGAYDGLGLAGTTGGHLFFILRCGDVFANSSVAVDSIKNVKITLDIGDGNPLTGFISGSGTGNRLFRIEFPTRTSLLTAGLSWTLDLEYSS